MSRKMARETSMQLLYQVDIGGSTPEEVINDFYENQEGLASGYFRPRVSFERHSKQYGVQAR